MSGAYKMRLESTVRVYGNNGRGPLFDSGAECGAGTVLELGKPRRMSFEKGRDVFREIMLKEKGTGRFVRVLELESHLDQSQRRFGPRGRLQSTATY